MWFFVNSKLCNVAIDGDSKKEFRVYIFMIFFFGVKRFLVCGNDRMIASRWETFSCLAAVVVAPFVDRYADKENLHSYLN